MSARGDGTVPAMAGGGGKAGLYWAPRLRPSPGTADVLASQILDMLVLILPQQRLWQGY